MFFEQSGAAPALSVELKALLLGEPPLTVAAAESITTGRVQAILGAVSGSSAFFLGGITAYSLEQKVKHLAVDRATARKVNSVSSDVAEQMARGVCWLFGSDLGVATTGYAEQSPADRVAQPFAFWALAHRATRGAKFVAIRSGRIECPGAKRAEAQQIIAEAVVAELVAYLREWRA